MKKSKKKQNHASTPLNTKELIEKSDEKSKHQNTDRRPEIYVGPRISTIIMEIQGFEGNARSPEFNYRLPCDGFIEVTKEEYENAVAMQKIPVGHSTNHGLPIVFTCVYKDENQKLLVFSRYAGAIKDTQTFKSCTPEQLKKFHLNKFYKLHIGLEQFHHCEYSEIYKVPEGYQDEIKQYPCEICKTVCYFDKNSYHICNVCAARLPEYEKFLYNRDKAPNAC